MFFSDRHGTCPHAPKLHVLKKVYRLIDKSCNGFTESFSFFLLKVIRFFKIAFAKQTFQCDILLYRNHLSIPHAFVFSLGLYTAPSFVTV